VQGAGTSTSDVCLVKVQTVHSTSASDILVCGPGIHVGDNVLTVRSQRKTSRELDRLVNASVLLRSATTTTAAQYPLQLLMLPHEAAFTAGAGAMPAAPVGRVRGRFPTAYFRSLCSRTYLCHPCAHAPLVGVSVCYRGGLPPKAQPANRWRRSWRHSL
jgi:hypothetical protein